MITPQQLANLLAQLPNQTQLHAPVISASGPIPTTVQSPVQSSESASAFSPPVHQLQNATLNEKASNALYPSPAPPPPAYAQQPPILSISSAMYAYTPTDAGDLALQPNDRIQVLEHMNNDCRFFFSFQCIFVATGKLNMRHRVAWPQRANEPRGNLPPKLC